MSTFWEEEKQKILKIKLERARHLANGGLNPDFDLQYPHLVRAKAKGQLSEIDKEFKDKTVKFQEDAIKRRKRYFGED